MIQILFYFRTKITFFERERVTHFIDTHIDYFKTYLINKYTFLYYILMIWFSDIIKNKLQLIFITLG